MTKEELKQEAKERADEYTNLRPFHIGYEEGYFDGAEPREKQIQIDAEQIRALQKQNGELTDKVNDLEDKLANADYQLEGRDNEINELKAQIQKMKRCEICKHYLWNHCSYETNISEDCIQNKLKHFELKEIKEND